MLLFERTWCNSLKTEVCFRKGQTVGKIWSSKVRKIRHFELFFVTKWRNFRTLDDHIFLMDCPIPKQTSVLWLLDHVLSDKSIKLAISIIKFFKDKFVTSFTFKKCHNWKNKNHTICKSGVFYVHGKFRTCRVRILEVTTNVPNLMSLVAGVIRKFFSLRSRKLGEMEGIEGKVDCATLSRVTN